MKSIALLFVSAMLFASSAMSKAQALPTASRAPFQVGVGWSFASSDYGPDYIKGATVFGDFGLTRRLGAEADLHFTSMSTPNNIGESTYLFGPRYSIALENRANIYVKALAGFGRFTYEAGPYFGYSHPVTRAYGVGAFGAGIEFQASPRINLRAIDVEYQRWSGFPPNGLSPFVVTMGVAYTR